MNSCARLAAASTLMLTLAGCSLASSSTPVPTVTVTVTPSAPPSTPSAPPSTPPVPLTDVTVCVTPVVTCQGERKSQPSQIILSGDGTAFVTGLAWTGWGLEGASAHGTLKLDNCNPNCAQGSLSSYFATIVLSKLTPYGSGQQAYADMLVDAAGSPFGTKSYHHLAP